MEPCVRLRDRVCREFKNRKTFLHPVERAVSVDIDKVAQPARSEPLNGDADPNPNAPSVMVVYTPARRRVIDTVLDYLTALRLLMCTYAKVGSFTVPAPSGGHQVFMPWQVAMHYVDEVIPRLLAYARSQGS